MENIGLSEKENTQVIYECLYNQEEVIKIFNIFMESIRAIRMNLITYKGCDGNTQYVNERAFAYELYRQIANRLYGNALNDVIWFINKPQIVINAEIYKHENKTNEKGKEEGVYPDIVIHGGQDNKDKQILISEIKKEVVPGGLNKDVEKLLTYMNSEYMYEHPYPLAVFINVGPIRNFIDHLDGLLIKQNFKGCLLFVSYDSENVKIVKAINGDYLEE